MERRLESVWERFRPRRFLLDSYQGVAIAQSLVKRGVEIEACPVTGTLNLLAFEALSELLSSGRLTWVRQERLEAELLNLELEQTRSAWRVVDSDRRYHRDLAWSLAAACHAGVSEQRGSGVTVYCDGETFTFGG